MKIECYKCGKIKSDKDIILRHEDVFSNTNIIHLCKKCSKVWKEGDSRY